MQWHNLIGYIGIHAIITDFFLGWANIFLEGRVGISPGSDHAFYCDVFYFPRELVSEACVVKLVSESMAPTY